MRRRPVRHWLRTLSLALGWTVLAAGASEQNTAWIPAQLPEAAAEIPAEDLALLGRLVDQITRDFIEPKTRHELIVAALRGMVASLDKYSMLIEDKAVAGGQAGHAGEFGGIGVELEVRDDIPRILRAYHDGPAAQAGLLAGDSIIEVAGKRTAGLALDDVIAAIKGPPRSDLALQLLRAGQEEPFRVTLQRQIVRARTVDVELGRSGVIIARVSEFLDSTPGELIDQLLQAVRAGTPPGLVLDLRGNPGGIVDAAVRVASAFLPPNVVVMSARARAGGSSHPYLTSELFWAGSGDAHAGAERTALGVLLRAIPLVVLVDRRSASSSEILASALQDHRRARIVGCGPSLGKGTIQSILRLAPGYSLKLTTAHYLTPAGHQLEGSGVAPDVLVSTPAMDSSGAENACDENPALALNAAHFELARIPQAATAAPQRPPGR